ncbi:MAG: hypothetical protein M1821_007218 [Bathelium mastoideum]|nr:MAG: hypothetical protein M1821_007218 [Bathelium mastoideum]
MAEFYNARNVRRGHSSRDPGVAPGYEPLPFPSNEHPLNSNIGVHNGLSTYVAPVEPLLYASESHTQQRLYDSAGVFSSAAPAPPPPPRPTNEPFLLPAQPSLQSRSSHSEQGHVDIVAQARQGKVKYSTADWERHLPKIQRLYFDEGMTLDDTMTVMEREDGFAPTPNTNALQMVWRGKARADFQATFEQAQQLHRSRHLTEAEVMYREALSGFDRLVTVSHEETMTVAYTLAQFYAETDRMKEADEVLNWLNQKLLADWAVPTERLLQHIKKVTNMYYAWSRGRDADALFTGTMSYLENRGKTTSTALNQPLSTLLGASVDNGQLPSTDFDQNRLPPVTNIQPTEWLSQKSTDAVFVDMQIIRFKEMVKAADRSIEGLLSSAADHCQLHLEKLSIQCLRLRKLQVKIYSKVHEDDQLATALKQSRESVRLCVHANSGLPWLLLGVAARIARWHLKLGHTSLASEILEYIAGVIDKKDDTRRYTLRAFCTLVGKYFQELNNWRAARPWFERALAVSLSMYCRHQQNLIGETQKLEEALEEEHYKWPVHDPSAEMRSRPGVMPVMNTLGTSY